MRDTGVTFVCAQGEPAWGYLYRNFIPPLAKLGRVVVPDHMGFGKSETPQDRSHSIREHYENLERLLLDLDVRDVTLMTQD
jgi:pimeloyl-ACP methyl ester carboxylesterase